MDLSRIMCNHVCKGHAFKGDNKLEQLTLYTYLIIKEIN